MSKPATRMYSNCAMHVEAETMTSPLRSSASLAAKSGGRIVLHDAAEGGHGALLKLLLEQDPLQLISA